MNRKIEEKNYNFFVQCDITYSKELHDLHNDYPLAPERIIDNKLKKSTYQESIIKKIEKEYNMKIGKSKVHKLVSTLSNKSSYVVHGKLFMYYKHLGLKMNVTKILSFEANHGWKILLLSILIKGEKQKMILKLIILN